MRELRGDPLLQRSPPSSRQHTRRDEVRVIIRELAEILDEFRQLLDERAELLPIVNGPKDRLCQLDFAHKSCVADVFCVGQRSFTKVWRWTWLGCSFAWEVEQQAVGCLTYVYAILIAELLSVDGEDVDGFQRG